MIRSQPLVLDLEVGLYDEEVVVCKGGGSLLEAVSWDVLWVLVLLNGGGHLLILLDLLLELSRCQLLVGHHLPSKEELLNLSHCHIVDLQSTHLVLQVLLKLRDKELGLLFTVGSIGVNLVLEQLDEFLLGLGVLPVLVDLGSHVDVGLVIVLLAAEDTQVLLASALQVLVVAQLVEEPRVADLLAGHVSTKLLQRDFGVRKTLFLTLGGQYCFVGRLPQNTVVELAAIFIHIRRVCSLITRGYFLRLSLLPLVSLTHELSVSV